MLFRSRLSNVSALVETMNRRRASGGPAEKTFANLVGLELRPRLLRTASDFWAKLTAALGVEQRDALWQHPDFLPSRDDLDDVEAFIASRSVD